MPSFALDSAPMTPSPPMTAVERARCEFRCVRCDYQLAGLADERCPECGENITISRQRLIDRMLPMGMPEYHATIVRSRVIAAVVALIAFGPILVGGGVFLTEIQALGWITCGLWLIGAVIVLRKFRLWWGAGCLCVAALGALPLWTAPNVQSDAVPWMRATLPYAFVALAIGLLCGQTVASLSTITHAARAVRALEQCAKMLMSVGASAVPLALFEATLPISLFLGFFGVLLGGVVVCANHLKIVRMLESGMPHVDTVELERNDSTALVHGAS